MGKIYQVEVHGLREKKLLIDLCNTEEQMQKMTVRQLKEKIAEKLPETAGQENLRLIFTDKQLQGDTSLLSEYGIQNMSVIHLALKVPGGGAFLPAARKERSADFGKMGKIYQVVVHGLRLEKTVIDLCNTEEQMQKMTVRQLKEKIAEKLPYIAGQENLRLIFTDKVLQGNTKLLSEYGIQHLSVIQLVLRVPGRGGV